METDDIPQNARPNLFIVGAPKSGTSSLYRYLSGHPDIFMTDLKEPHFFGRDLVRINRPSPDLNKYLSRYEGAERFQIRGEASTSYLQSTSAPHEIINLSPDARIIIILRNPVDVMYALHGEHLLSGFEEFHDFEEALEAESYRRSGKHQPNRPGMLNLLFYRDVVDYPRHVKRYVKVFGRSSVLVLFFENFFSSPERHFKEVLRFLGVHDCWSPEFDVVNPSKRVRFKWLQKFLASPPSVLDRLGGVLIPEHLHGRLSNRFLQWNTRVEQRPPLSDNLRQRLRKEQSDRIERLAELLGDEPPW